MNIKLVRPDMEYKTQVIDYKRAMLENGDDFDGCARLEKCDTFEEWLDFETQLGKAYGKNYVPSEVFLAVRMTDGKVVGMVDYRHPLSDFLKKYGGNIGYSVRPDERRKGYATEMLSLVLDVCREYGEKSVLLTCDKRNEASRKTILKNGGVLENEICDETGFFAGITVQRYWIEL